MCSQRKYLARQNSSNTWHDCDGQVFRDEELKRSRPNRDNVPLANSWDNVSELIEADVGIDHKESCCGHVVQSGGGKLNQGMRQLKRRVDSNRLARQLESSKNGTQQKPA